MSCCCNSDQKFVIRQVSSAPVQASSDEPADVSKASLSVKGLCCYLWVGCE